MNWGQQAQRVQATTITLTSKINTAYNLTYVVYKILWKFTSVPHIEFFHYTRFYPFNGGVKTRFI